MSYVDPSHWRALEFAMLAFGRIEGAVEGNGVFYCCENDSRWFITCAHVLTDNCLENADVFVHYKTFSPHNGESTVNLLAFDRPDRSDAASFAAVYSLEANQIMWKEVNCVHKFVGDDADSRESWPDLVAIRLPQRLFFQKRPYFMQRDILMDDDNGALLSAQDRVQMICRPPGIPHWPLVRSGNLASRRLRHTDGTVELSAKVYTDMIVFPGDSGSPIIISDSNGSHDRISNSHHPYINLNRRIVLVGFHSAGFDGDSAYGLGDKGEEDAPLDEVVGSLSLRELLTKIKLVETVERAQQYFLGRVELSYHLMELEKLPNVISDAVAVDAVAAKLANDSAC